MVVYILVTLISGAVGAWIGTYYGAQFSAKKQEQRNKEMRNMAIKGLNILRKYSGKGNTYDMAEAEFNNSLSGAEKRVFIVGIAIKEKADRPAKYFEEKLEESGLF